MAKTELACLGGGGGGCSDIILPRRRSNVKNDRSVQLTDTSNDGRYFDFFFNF